MTLNLQVGLSIKRVCLSCPHEKFADCYQLFRSVGSFKVEISINDVGMDYFQVKSGNDYLYIILNEPYLYPSITIMKYFYPTRNGKIWRAEFFHASDVMSLTVDTGYTEEFSCRMFR